MTSIVKEKWLSTTKSDFHEELKKISLTHKLIFNNVSVASDNRHLIKYLQKIINIISLKKEIHIYVSCNSSYILNGEIEDNLCLINNNKLIIYSSDFGSIRSSIFGFITSVEKKYPMHAAAFTIDNIGFAIIGGHAAGKTTNLLQLIRFFGNRLKVLTDDWCSGSSINSELVLEAPIEGMNLTIAEQKVFFNKLKTKIVPNEEKIFITDNIINNLFIKKILSPKCFILLDGISRELDTHYTSVDTKVASFQIVDSSYHYPYLDSEITDNHIVFWLENIKDISLIKFKAKEIYASGNHATGIIELVEDQLQNIKEGAST